ncbi:MAG TPA: acyltransferase [Mucilaginibacter sp.]|nr:acyltransferase [Mucilaginibacter sp.]
MAAKRFENIDLLKGLLIILVMLGHILQGSLSENFSRYLIYSFHMPVFVGISGFLFNSSKINSVSFKELLSKYLFRIIIPWAIAVLVYDVITHWGHITPSDLIHSFPYPYYHLWFIPAFLSWVFFTWIAGKLKIAISWLLVFSVAISYVFFMLTNYPTIYEHTPDLSKPLDLILDTFRPRYYMFFVFGIYLRTHTVKISLALNISIALISFAGIALLFFFPNKTGSISLFFLFNLSFLNILITKAREGFFPRSTSIEWVGVNSLAVYLWHVIPIIIVKSLVGTGNLLLFYSVVVAAEILFVLLMAQLTKIKPVNKYLLGMG